MSDKLTAPAVIVGGGLNALGIVRSLGSVGVPLIVVDRDSRSPAMRSRYGRKVLCPSVEGDGLIGCLLGLAEDFAVPGILFLTEERSVVTVSQLRERISGKFLIRLPDHHRLMDLMHKAGFQRLAEAADAPVPRTVDLRSLDDLALVETLRFPCVLKPSNKDDRYAARFNKAYRVASLAEVAELYRQIHPVLADMVVQEWIEGADSEIYFCLQYVGKNDETVSTFTGRKVRSWPPRVGGTASCTAAWEQAPELSELTSRFFRQVGFTGMGSMEYKRDERDGRFYVIEPTVARTDYQEEVATLNGVNIPLAAYRYELGLPALSDRPLSPPRIWRDPDADRWSFQDGGRVVDARSTTHVTCDAYWRSSDPRPWIDFTLRRLRLRLGPKG